LVKMISTATAFDWSFRKRTAGRLYGDVRSPRDGHLQHREILDALVARDGARAEEAMRSHIVEAAEAFMAVARGAADESTTA
jgi:DNA-binding GntR family transcriptional regulator